MRITDWRAKEDRDSVEVSAEVDGFRLSFRLPSSYPYSTSADPFLAVALLPAMASEQALEVDPALPVSPQLLRNTGRLQEIFNSWNPALKIVPVTATTAPARPLTDGALSFFSGGVDSTYTFLKRGDELDHVVFINGFEFDPSKRAIWESALRRNSAFAAGFGKTLIPVETNVYPFGYRYNLSRNLTHGSWLGATALLLGFSRAYVPSSYSYRQQVPVGSHPLTDPLWSNECVEVIHEGAEARRVDKIVYISKCDTALANLQVCFNLVAENCGRCSKCLRTSIPLALLGVSTPAFPPLPSLRQVRRSLSTYDEIEMVFVQENLEFARSHGVEGSQALERTLRNILRRAEMRRGLRLIDSAVSGGLVRQTRRRLARALTPGNPEPDRIGTTPPPD